MDFFNFQQNPMWLNLVICAVAAAAIWSAGQSLERNADAISDRTGWSGAFTGLLLLALAGSLPEVATTVTAVLIGNVPLALSNLLGGIVIQTASLAATDFVARKRGALTYFTPDFGVLIQGVGLLLLLMLVIAGSAEGGRLSVFGIGLWPVAIFSVYLLVLFLVHRYQCDPRWVPDGERHPGRLAANRVTLSGESDERAGRADGEQQAADPAAGRTLVQLAWSFAGASLIVLAAGVTIARGGDALATQTGLGGTFIGATLVALSTSLPELSMSVSAGRNGNYSLGFSNILGSNALMAALLFPAELLSRGEPVLARMSPSQVFLTAAGGVVTCIYLWGLLERENRTIGRLGWDSIAVLVVTGITLLVVYQLR